ncbi:hypothetical protein H5410_017258 [Solanum commersonii]|uniref:Uncharacterized protein n=1 Tax=Solanum commersonii TaxID=4109 RepID=A0A9J5ZZI3_SOLCO|nr:hypothetical protein H5410_017258 [Solanum commersonii]
MLSKSATSKQQGGERLDRYIKAKEFTDETKILIKILKTISDPNKSTITTAVTTTIATIFGIIS